jgi:hypothetical protein
MLSNLDLTRSTPLKPAGRDQGGVGFVGNGDHLAPHARERPEESAGAWRGYKRDRSSMRSAIASAIAHAASTLVARRTLTVVRHEQGRPP